MIRATLAVVVIVGAILAACVSHIHEQDRAKCLELAAKLQEAFPIKTNAAERCR